MSGPVLIANRGEIAARIARSCRRLGWPSIAVFSDVDATAQHVAAADQAEHIGPANPRESYLCIPALIAAAERSGARYVHPGYGFLSENADFAEACARAGLVFIGPPPAAIRAMGGKAEARRLAAASGLPCLPGADDALEEAAARIGYPVMIKAVGGGGGRGMRRVASAEEMPAALEAARREAAISGDDRLMLEKLVEQARHIEVQILADTHGNVLHLHERDCTLQRRHQKLVEECPAPGMDAALRAELGRRACTLARAVGYVGAGTVEFISEGDTFAFMEMNTRLQVEHPVTEAITGQDLVEWQLRIAMGEPLPLAQAEIPLAGHAIEVRLYAEDPARDFAPSIGTLRHLDLPAHLPGIRIDSGVREGDAVPIHYDPMLAKIIAAGPDRATALRRLSRALDAAAVAGIRSNLPLLRAIAAHPAFAAADLDTGFIARHAAALLPEAGPVPRAALAAAALRLLRDAEHRDAADPHSPWGSATAWRLNGDGYQDFQLIDGEAELGLRLHPGHAIDFADGSAALDAPSWDGDALSFTLDGRAIRATVARDGDLLMVVLGGATHDLRHRDPRAPSGEEQAGGGRILAPMPGRILQLLAAPGDRVARGAVLLVMEAMKVQMRITAPVAGTVAALRCTAGDLVEDGAELVVVDPDPPA